MSEIELSCEDGVAFLKIDNRAKLNVLTPNMLQSLDDHCEEIDQRRDIRAVILTAAESAVFCAGADIKAWGALSPVEFARDWVQRGHRVFARLAGLSKPTIAALSGDAIGGGLELAISCDIRIATPDAGFSLPETQLGVVPGWSGTQRLTRLLPEPVLREMVLFGARLPAQRALDLGFVTELSSEPVQTAKNWAEMLLKQAPDATTIAKFMLNAGVGEGQDRMIEVLGSGMASALPEKSEGVRSFQEKRKPRFLP